MGMFVFVLLSDWKQLLLFQNSLSIGDFLQSQNLPLLLLSVRDSIKISEEGQIISSGPQQVHNPAPLAAATAPGVHCCWRTAWAVRPHQQLYTKPVFVANQNDENRRSSACDTFRSNENYGLLLDWTTVKIGVRKNDWTLRQYVNVM